MAKFKTAAEAFRTILTKSPNITAKEAIAEAKKLGVKATFQNFYDTKGRMKTTKSGTQKKGKTKADWIRTLLQKNPNITFEKAKNALVKNGISITASQFYDIRRKSTSVMKASQKKGKNKADWIRTLLQKDPDITFEEAKAALVKKGITITGSQFYDIRRKSNTLVMAQKHGIIQEDYDVPRAEWESRAEWEVEQLRQQIQRLQAVIAALLA